MIESENAFSQLAQVGASPTLIFLQIVEWVEANSGPVSECAGVTRGTLSNVRKTRLGGRPVAATVRASIVFPSLSNEATTVLEPKAC